MTSSDFPDPPLSYIKDNYSILRGPPPIPEDGVYSLYGKERKLDESQSFPKDRYEQMFTEPINYKADLPRLLNLIIEKISILLTMLGSNENIDEEQLRRIGDELSSIIVNLLYLVNEYRSHQAREILIQLKRNQLNARKAMIQKIKNQIQRSREEIIQSLDDMSNEATMPPALETEEHIKEYLVVEDSNPDSHMHQQQQHQSMKVADYISNILNN